MARSKKPTRPRWGDPEPGSLADRARYDRALKKKIEEGRKKSREDSQEREAQLLAGERSVRRAY